MTPPQLPAGWDEQRIHDLIVQHGGRPTSTDEGPATLTPEAIRVLCREIGLANTARVVQSITGGYGNYIEERDALIGHLTLDDIIAEIKRRRSTQPPQESAAL